ncbi:MAG: TonB-dependent receptor [Sterolibacteriaceae bacterium MAG5]|nr:TonB-dependent receptor [Candidatus Nitricoxidireducens bremensis]
MPHPIARSALVLGLACPLVCSSAAAESGELDAVVVTATRQPMRVSELVNDITVIERAEIERAGQVTLSDFLARQPGVQQAANGSPGANAAILLRGGNAGHTLVLLDGQRIGSGTLGSGIQSQVAWSRLPLSQIERIEVLRGPASSLYGADAVSGVIQIFTRRGDGAPHVYADAGIGSYSTTASSAGASGASGAFRYSVNVAQTRTEGFNSIVNKRNTSHNPDADGFANESVTANLGYEMAPGHELGFNFFQSEGRNRYDSRSTTAPITPSSNSYENGLTVKNYGATLRNRVTDSWNSTLRLGRAIDDSTAYSNGTMTDVTRTEQGQASWQHDLRVAGGNLLLGWEGMAQRIGGTRDYTVKERTVKSFLAGWNGRLGDHRLQANARHDDNSQFGSRNTGSVGWGYQFDARWRGQASAGTAFRAPSFNDLYYPLKSGLVGNPNLKPESSQSRELALHHEGGGIQASVTWYLNRVTDMIVWSGKDAANNTIPINVGRARIEGVTLFARGHLAGFDVDGSIDHLEAIDQATNKYLRLRARETINAGIGRTAGPWQWRGELQFIGGRFDDDANTKHMGSVSVTNLQGSYALARDWSLFGRVNNLFGKRYELTADFAAAGTNAFLGLRYSPQ